MIKVMSFSCGVRTQHAFIWVSIIWFTSAVSVAVSGSMVQHIISSVEAQCGDNLTLTCGVTSSQQLDYEIKKIYWVAKNKTLCQYQINEDDPDILCEWTANTSNPTLKLTLLNVLPVNQGNYLCKLYTNQGLQYATTNVTVRDCTGSSHTSINRNQAKCSFSGYYPRGIVHWFQGDVNLTDFASTHEEKDQYGKYNVWSTIDVQNGNMSEPYNCSLWIESGQKYVNSKMLFAVGENILRISSKASGSMIKLQWICIIVEIMMVTFMI